MQPSHGTGARGGAITLSGAPAHRPGRRTSFVVFAIASLLGVGVVVQLFFVGMALFVDSLYWWPHHTLGRAFGPAAVILFLLTLAFRQPPRIRWLAFAVVITVFVQGALAAIRGVAGALHPVNAILVSAAIAALVRETWITWKSGSAGSADPA